MTILLTPARIGGVTVKNRIVMPPMTTRTADDDGCVTQATVAYDVARALRDVPLIGVNTTPRSMHRYSLTIRRTAKTLAASG
jgi:2,4-dienoyl-CoA reductase-like NADH-dependent reductase (Old Yellow Enzyme family)